MKPRDSMKAGRAIESTDLFRSNWKEVKYDIMSSVIFDKFYRNIELRQKLLATGNKYIEESNHWHDVYWGVCNGKGKSNLGKILMGVREFWKLNKNTINDNQYKLILNFED